MSELESIQRRAHALGMRPAHFSRSLLLAQERQPLIPREIPGNGDILIYTALSRLGNNLNQLMRHLHRTGDPLPPDLDPLLKDIRSVLDRRNADDR